MRYLSYTIVLVFITLFSLAQSPHGKAFDYDCALCHSPINWEVVRQNIKFNHDSAAYKLIGQHLLVDCRNCHDKLVFHDIGNECNQCHADVHSTTVGEECSRCHNPSTWKISNIGDLHQQGRFELLGAHKNATCTGCHKAADDLLFESLGLACVDCHSETFQQTSQPNHAQKGFSGNCLDCHDPESRTWNTDNVDHNFFPLEEGHDIGCIYCHVSGTLEALPTECITCHQENFNTTQEPNHIEAGMQVTCEDCHTTEAWKPSSFNHITTGFELTGGHLNVEYCSGCHMGTLFTASPECISCHQVQYDYAPDHKQYGYSFECTQCHTTNDWLETDFDHYTTAFPLTGLHVGVDCSSCHANGFAGTPTDCNGCHQNDHATAQAPSHVIAGIPTGCEDCHATSGWTPSSFNHIATGFELTGGHLNAEQCSACHLGSLNNTDQECVSCHKTQYNSAADHVSQGYPNACAMCHNTNHWLETDFDHNTTAFPLTGLHIGADCFSCHASGFAGTPTDCNGCHQQDHTMAQAPNHVNAGIPTACKDCHATSGWTPSSFDHITMGFELSNGHLNVDQCSDCHLGSLTKASQDCISCHQTQYSSAPDHVGKGYPASCTMCHTTNNWLETDFDHNTAAFPLTGAHISVNCSECHSGGFLGTSTQCYRCHQSDYSSTRDPNHASANFPTDCASCHNTNAWEPSTFNHDALYFQIYSGRHGGEWNSCTDCHTNVSNYSVFSCIVCHEHNRSDMDREHRGVFGYSYASAVCLICHTGGRGD